MRRRRPTRLTFRIEPTPYSLSSAAASGRDLCGPLDVILIWEIAEDEHTKPMAIVRERGGAV
jgi:hypothetical protein